MLMLDGMTVGQALALFVAAMGVPGAVTGIIVWRFQKKIEARDRRREQEERESQRREKEQEEARERLQLLNTQGTLAALGLAEATARAVERIPDTNCNGEMRDALAYATGVKRDLKGFLREQGIRAVVK